ncbi:hypothetical protein FVB9288_00242 [Flavobacterium sp. CECT 9288]|uniref:hypothetical protein n=1 Tax=Flavobacterium sp. CECT 9288 TaxID=2845819 RepID=UPI001E5ACB8B|nr:hypothetical protein [Flavobacterium sp. CECT 9288]CAH0334649.1 hypothetical protein FVB9288_00242 [Flavobacterium sp. CECT 9288]
MKKIVFCLLAVGMTAFASASTGEIGKPVKETVRKEIVSKKKLEKLKTVEVKEEVKTVKCTLYTGVTTSNPSGWETFEYSCFFCWGGSENGCLASAAKESGLAL